MLLHVSPIVPELSLTFWISEPGESNDTCFARFLGGGEGESSLEPSVDAERINRGDGIAVKGRSMESGVSIPGLGGLWFGDGHLPARTQTPPHPISDTWRQGV